MRKRTLFTLSASIGFILGSICSIMIVVAYKTPTVDAQTKTACEAMAIQNKQVFAHTEFRDADFYTMCIDNIEYTSPLSLEAKK